MHIFIQMVADLLVFNHGTLAEILKVRQWELYVYFSDLPLTRLIGSPGVKKIDSVCCMHAIHTLRQNMSKLAETA